MRLAPSPNHPWNESDRSVLGQIYKVWWPLAFSWLLMAVEIPAISAVIARLPDARVNLAAFGGVVYPLALIIEAPIIMLLSASTALCKDWQSFYKVRRFMMWTGAFLTCLHALVVFTPLYYLVVGKLLQIPPEVIEPARFGLGIMLPWSWAIGYRRFHQGVLIRFGHSDAVGIGTVVRLLADAAALGVGFYSGALAGIVVGTIAQALGVVSEAAYSGLRVRPVLEKEVKPIKNSSPLSWKVFALFYGPLVLTSILSLVWNPVGSAALSRMKDPLSSLAVWPVVSGLVFMLRSPGIAFNEVVIAMLDKPKTARGLQRFSFLMIIICSAVYLVIAATPLSGWWFQKVSALPPDLTALAISGFWLGLPLPLFSVMQSWYQGAILHSRNTKAIPESLAVFFASVTVLLAAGVFWNGASGLIVAMTAFLIANAAQTAWLWWRSRPAFRLIAREQDAVEAADIRSPGSHSLA